MKEKKKHFERKVASLHFLAMSIPYFLSIHSVWLNIKRTNESYLYRLISNLDVWTAPFTFCTIDSFHDVYGI